MAAATDEKSSPVLTVVEDSIYELPIADIDPDPDQVRSGGADDDLEESIRDVGVLDPITVRPHPETGDRWMISNGERRWRASIKAGLKTIPSRITYEADDEGDRLYRQVVHNLGKPLSPTEEAHAWSRIMEAKGWSQIVLAKKLGKPRTTIGDRLRLLEIPKVWSDLIDGGSLTTSHAAVIHPYHELPDFVHARMFDTLAGSHEWVSAVQDARPIGVDTLRRCLYHVASQLVTPLDGVPGYAGPVAQFAMPRRDQWTAGDKTAIAYAVDAEQFRPIVEAREHERRAKQMGHSEPNPAAEARAAAKAAKKPSPFPGVPEGTAARTQISEHEKRVSGVGILTDANGRWAIETHDSGKQWDPADIGDVAPESLVRLIAPGGKRERLGTTGKAVSRAKKLWRERWAARRVQLEAERRDMILARESEFRVTGGAALALGVLDVTASPYSVAQTFGKRLLMITDMFPLQFDILPRHRKVIERDVFHCVPEISALLASVATDLLLSRYATMMALGLADLDKAIEREQKAVLQEAKTQTPPWGLRPDAEAIDDLDDDRPLDSCLYCGCEEGEACELEGGGECSWHLTDPHVCTNPDCMARHLTAAVGDVGTTLEDVLGDTPLEREIATRRAELAGT